MQFHSQDPRFSLSKPRVFSLWLKDLLLREGREAGRIHYVFCTDAQLLELNRSILRHNYYTDIITFPYPAARPRQVDADVYISTDTVLDNANTYHTTFYHELSRVMAHGLLHCCGYDDHTEADSLRMRQKEDAYLALRPASLVKLDASAYGLEI